MKNRLLNESHNLTSKQTIDFYERKKKHYCSSPSKQFELTSQQKRKKEMVQEGEVRIRE